MELVNDAYRLKDGLYGDARRAAAVRFATATAASLIFPFAPHLGAEVWERLDGGRVWEEPWPEADPELLASDTVTLVVQVNGKLRDRIEAPADAPEEELLALPRASEKVAATSTAKRSSRRSSCRASWSTWSFAERPPRRSAVRFWYKAAVLVRRLSEAPVEEWHRLRTHVLMDAGELGSRNISVTWLEFPAGAEQTLRSARGGRAGLRRRARRGHDVGGRGHAGGQRGRPDPGPARDRPLDRQRRRGRARLHLGAVAAGRRL